MNWYKVAIGLYTVKMTTVTVDEEWEDNLEGGLSDNKKPSDYNQKQLEMGQEVEMEHTNDKEIATEIAMDHLEEFPNYYDELRKMENKLENQKQAQVLKNNIDIFNDIVKVFSFGIDNYPDLYYTVPKKTQNSIYIDFFDESNKYQFGLKINNNQYMSFTLKNGSPVSSSKGRIQDINIYDLVKKSLESIV